MEIVHSTHITTRFCESDALGHINNVSYFIYLEQARVEFLLETKIVSSSENWPFILASVHCDYKQQIYINDRLVIRNYVIQIGRSSVKLGHEIYREGQEEMLAYGEETLVHYDFINQNSCPLTDDMRIKLEKSVKLKV